MQNGVIPAGTECIWKDTCKVYKNNNCSHVGPHENDYTCDYASAYEFINNAAGIPQPKIKQRKQFEYCVAPLQKFNTQKDFLDFINEKGKLGWELTETNYGYFIFKREKI